VEHLLILYIMQVIDIHVNIDFNNYNKNSY
jgi:hypothetical protein